MFYQTVISELTYKCSDCWDGPVLSSQSLNREPLIVLDCFLETIKPYHIIDIIGRHIVLSDRFNLFRVACNNEVGILTFI